MTILPKVRINVNLNCIYLNTNIEILENYYIIKT